MKRRGNSFSFQQSDMQFIKKFGISAATEMVIDYATLNKTAFIYDTHQLAGFLGIGHRELFLLLKHKESFYFPITLKKKNGKERTVYSPKYSLKTAQWRILAGIVAHLPTSKYATAYKKGTSIVANAAPHTGKKHLLKMDIVNFFDNITFEQIYSAAFNSRYYPKHIGVMLTKLCCRKDVLAQGAPSSPALSNVVMKHFDDVMGEWCKRRDIAYTRYCDDITFSSDKPLYTAYAKASSLLGSMGFEVNESKTHFLTNGGRQEVTGLTVNERVSVSREYKRNLRQELYYALKFGLKDCILRGGYSNYIRDGIAEVERFYLHLLGSVNYVLSIEHHNPEFLKARDALLDNDILDRIY